MKKFTCLSIFLLMLVLQPTMAQRRVDKLDRGLVAMKSGTGVYLSWRIFGEEYYDVQYHVYRNEQKITTEPLNVSNYRDASGKASDTYAVAPVIRGEEKDPCPAVPVWGTSYKEITLTHEGILSTLVPNDATCADVDGDGELEIIMKFDNLSEIEQAYPKYGPKIGDVVTGEYTIFECFKLDGTRLWWINCGPNMGDFQNNEQNIIAYDWDGDGKAEVILRAADGTVVHHRDGTTFTVGNSTNNERAANGGGVNWFQTTDKEYLLYLNGETAETYHCFSYPLRRLDDGETDLTKAWGDKGWAHRCSKHFFGAPYLDGRNPSIFLARGIYTRHKMIAYDVNPATHKLVQRWRWDCNANGPWKGQGYHNYTIADVDMDGRDEIVFGSMVIDDNGKGLSTTGFGHGDAHHVSDLDPYHHGLEIFACMEDDPGTNYRDATTSKVYYRYDDAPRDVGRCMAGNFTNSFPGAMGTPTDVGPISLVKAGAVSGLGEAGVNQNMRIYWDGDLLSETFNYVNGTNTAGCVAKYGSWSPIYTMEGSLTNNDSKGTPCYQGDILGDWREEVIMRTANNNIRIYSTPTFTNNRVYTLWHDHQYRNAMVWQMCGYNQPPHLSYFLGELEGITTPPPPLSMTDRTEVANNGIISSELNGKHVIVCETKNTKVSIEDGAMPYILTFNVPTWVEGSAPSECTTKSTPIKTTTYTCTVTGGGLAGEARLVKQGDGVLSLPAVEFTHTGETNIWEGTLNFNGTMKNSPLWLNRFSELNADGASFKSIRSEYGAVIRPGGANKRGTITTGEMTLGFGSRIIVDLYGEDISSDTLKVRTLNLEHKTGTAWEKGGPQYLTPVIQLVGHLGNGETALKPGKYVVAEATEGITGTGEDVVLEGLETTKKYVYVEDNKLIVEILGLRDATTITWNGNAGNTWDYAETANFSLEGAEEPTFFVSGDKVYFGDGASVKTISVDSDVYPDSIFVDNTAVYNFSGSGAISGGATLVKTGTGNLVMNGNNSYTGGNRLSGGTVTVKQLSNQYNATGNLGAMTNVASKFIMENGAILQVTSSTEMGSPMRMVGEEGGVINNTADLVMPQPISGTKLTKKGAGTMKISAGNTVQRLVIAAGTVANASGTPATTVEFQGGTVNESRGTSYNIEVPARKTGTQNLVENSTYTNRLTGAGTFTIHQPRLQSYGFTTRCKIQQNWSAFEGTVKATTAASDVYFSLDNGNGLPKGTLDIQESRIVVNSSGKAFAIGKVSGNSGTLGGVVTFSQSAPSGTCTWNLGWDGSSWSWGGKITGTSAVTKEGTCKMTFTGSGDFSGTCSVNAGELCLNSSSTRIMLGTNKLSVASGAMLTGKGRLGNSLTTISSGAILRSGATETNTNGDLNFGGKDLTVNGIVQSYISGKTSFSKFSNIGTLTLNGTLRLLGREGMSLTEGAEIQLFEASTIVLGSNLQLDLCEPNVAKGLTWDTSRLAEGILVVGPAPDGILSLREALRLHKDIYTLSGTRLTTPPMRSGIYIIDGSKVVIK